MPLHQCFLKYGKINICRYLGNVNSVLLSFISTRKSLLLCSSSDAENFNFFLLNTRNSYYNTSPKEYVDKAPWLPFDGDIGENTNDKSPTQTANFQDVNKPIASLETGCRRISKSGNRFWSRDILAEYLRLKDLSLRNHFWNHHKTEECGKLLPTILVHFLHRNSSTASWTLLDTSILKIADDTLKSRCLTWKDVEEWAYILTAPCVDEITRRLSDSTHQTQSFVLLHILNQDIKSVKTLEKVILCTWGLVLNKNLMRTGNQPDCIKNRVKEQKEDYHMFCNSEKSNLILPKNIDLNPSIQNLQYLQNDLGFIDLHTFNDLAKKILRHSRQIWPASMVSVAHMTTSFVNMYVESADRDPKSLDSYMSRQLCNLINNLLVEFCHQSIAEPYLLIVYNWQSQKILLKLASKFQPALILNHASYRAIIQVLACHKKTERQRKSMSRRARSWPPWCVAQNGMEMEELDSKEKSSVVMGIARLKEAGYGGDWFEDALRIIGGQEFDGTPTIQSRRILQQPSRLNECTDLGEMEPTLWAARIVATRDVHEAWSAFVQFKKLGGQPNQEMYLAMFQKMTFDFIRERRKRGTDVLPGDGLEVLPVPDNNYSDYYKRHLEPPSLEDLYSEMLRSGLKPQKRCLSFLVRNSRTPDEGLQYLRASGLGMDDLRSLGAFGSLSTSSDIMRIPLNIFSDYIHLICRFIPKLVLVSPYSAKGNGRPEWIIHQLKFKSKFGTKLDQPLHLAAYLLNTRKPTNLPPWYSFFRALSRENSIISWDFVGHPKNDILAWNVLKASFDDFSSCGLHLNTRGFSIICHGYEKYMRAISQTGEEDPSGIDEASQLIKREFKKMSETSSGLCHLPEMYQPIRGVHLHAYLRCLALAKDYKEIISTLEWMALNSENLREILTQESSSSERKFRRVFVVAGMCCQGTYFEARAREIITSVHTWHGWPSDDEIAEYKYNSPIEAEIST